MFGAQTVGPVQSPPIPFLRISLILVIMPDLSDFNRQWLTQAQIVGVIANRLSLRVGGVVSQFQRTIDVTISVRRLASTTK